MTGGLKSIHGRISYFEFLFKVYTVKRLGYTVIEVLNMLEAVIVSLISFVIVTLSTYLLKINAKVAKATRLEEINDVVKPLKKQIRDLEIQVVKLETKLECCGVKDKLETEVE